MIANLHMHSIYSDGSETPETIVKLASQSDIDIIALTDHNTFDGYPRFTAKCKELNVNYIKGIEIDVAEREYGYRSEILAYFPYGNDQKISHILENKQKTRTERVMRAVERSKEQFKIENISYDELKEKVKSERGFDGMISNKHLYQYLDSKGVDMLGYNTMQASSVWLNIWTMKNIAVEYGLLEVIEEVTKAGGFAVVPHFGIHCKFSPELMDERENEYIKLLKAMKERGLWGVEIHPYRYTPQADMINQRVRKWAKKLSLNLTYGSDFHGGISTHNIFTAMSGEFTKF